jgi:methionyl-tRNA formyltransferase
MRILFWGTPDFGVPSLRALQEEGHVVVAVVTQPDRPAGRGQTTRPGPIKEIALEEGIPVLQPEKPRGDDFLARLRELDPELSVVAAFGEILTDEVLALPTHGSINVHASLLPELRGAAPVNWAIIRGLEPDLTAGELYEMLSEIGATALVEALAQLEAGTLREEPQVHEHATYAPKMSRDGARLDWRLPAAELDRRIRGCDPWPGAWTTLANRPLQVFGPELDSTETAGAPGTVLVADAKQGLIVATGSGAIRVRQVKPAGRARMDAEAWIQGRGVEEGQSFE